MTGKELFFALGELDDAVIAEAAEAKPVNRGWTKWAALAACAALIVAAVPTAFFMQRKGSTASAESFSITAESAEVTEESEPAEAVTNGIFQPPKVSGAPDATARLMISEYHFDPEVEVCYAAPKNGTVIISAHLLGAIDAYGDEPIYRVVIDLFDGEQYVELTDAVLDAVSAELSAQGYTVAIEKAYLWDEPTGVYLTIHATAEQVRDFPSLSEYGVMLLLYGERAPIGDAIGDAVYSSSMN